jgi:hypothetical protein
MIGIGEAVVGDEGDEGGADGGEIAPPPPFNKKSNCMKIREFQN